jgi:hypothetical protein
MAKQPEKLTIKLDPAGRPVRLNEVRRLFDNLAACLAHVAETTLGESPDFAIAKLFTGSAGVVVSPDKTQPAEGAAAIRAFKKTARQLYDDSANGEVDAKSLELFRKLAMPASRARNQLWFDDLQITTQFIANIDKRLAKTIRGYGHLKGRLEKVNVHGKLEFVIYPILRTKGIRCTFTDDLRDVVGEAVKGKVVTLKGTMLYLSDEPFPYLVHVDDITIHPPDDALPTLHDLRGIAPDCTGKMSTLDFLRSIPNE